MSFGEDLRKLCERTKADMRTVVRTTAIDLQAGMVDRAPVDTGRLRANFQAGIGEINRSTGESPGSDAKMRTAAAMVAWKPGQTIFLTNSLPYAYVAEYGLYGKPPGSANGPKTIAGYSRQAPAGFVRLTVQDFSERLHAAVQAVK